MSRPAFIEVDGRRVRVRVEGDPHIEKRPMLDFPAGYIMRSIELFPQQGTTGPWTVEMNFRADAARLRKGPVEDAALRFSSTARSVATAGAARA